MLIFCAKYICFVDIIERNSLKDKMFVINTNFIYYFYFQTLNC